MLFDLLYFYLRHLVSVPVPLYSSPSLPSSPYQRNHFSYSLFIPVSQALSLIIFLSPSSCLCPSASLFITISTLLSISAESFLFLSFHPCISSSFSPYISISVILSLSSSLYRLSASHSLTLSLFLSLSLSIPLFLSFSFYLLG